jgi:hypothetical protein
MNGFHKSIIRNNVIHAQALKTYVFVLSVDKMVLLINIKNHLNPWLNANKKIAIDFII